MKLFFGWILAMTTATAFCETRLASLYQFDAVENDGSPHSLSRYQGKVALVVNTASKCGYTSQYKELQDLYTTYKERGFVVLAFPSNDFGGQEPGTDNDIKTFCEGTFGVAFPLFKKGTVKGADKQQIFAFLTQGEEIAWNFEKFLINKKGEVVARYKSATKPTDPALVSRLEELIEDDSMEEVKVQRLTPEEVAQKTQHGALLVDVRTPEEIAEGTLKGAKQIDSREFQERYNELLPQKDSEIILYCRSGGRSGAAAEFLVSQGFKKVYNGGGFNDLKEKVEWQVP